MTIIIVLNVVLAIAVVGGILFLLGRAITSSRPDQDVVVAVRHAPRPYGPRTHRSLHANRRPRRAEPEPVA